MRNPNKDEIIKKDVSRNQCGIRYHMQLSLKSKDGENYKMDFGYRDYDKFMQKRKLDNKIKINISKEEFEAYERVRASGRINMVMITGVSAMSGLPRDKVKEIIQNYSELNEKYPGVRK